MKKSLVLGIVSLAAAAVTSYGQGYIWLDNYISGGTLLVYGSDLFSGPSVPANGVSGPMGVIGTGLNNDWTVGLYWAPSTVSLTDPAGPGMPMGPLVLGTGLGSTVSVAGPEAFGMPGYYSSMIAFNSGSTANTTITLEIVVYDTAGGSYAAAAYRMHSAPFSMPTAAAPSASVPGTGAYMPGQLFWTPEPSTLTLVGLGGLALWLMQRKKA